MYLYSWYFKYYKVDILGVDISGVDILGVDILRLTLHLRNPSNCLRSI